MSFLLESVEGGAVRGRYSIIGLEPDVVFRINSAHAEINRKPQDNPDAFSASGAPPLAALRALIAESRIALPDTLPPMSAGIFGYLGYDTVRLIEDTLSAPGPDPLGIPDGILVRPNLVVAFDAVKDTITIVTPVRPQAGVTAEAALARAAERLSAVVDALDRPLDKSALDADAGPPEVTPRSNTPAEEFKRMVLRAKEYIAAGDIFQVVLSQRFEAPFALAPFALYRALRRVNPSPYLFFLDCGSFAVAGSSPEILVKTGGGKVTIRPVAGTRRRGATPHEDKALEEELLADPKERAEHLMLLDLGRNDVGRVAEIGTVKVTDQFFIERFSQVMHIVSNVEGKLRADRDALDALAAGFPAGTVSGAPKCARCRSSTSWRRKSVRSMPAASGISRRAPTWIPASCCAPPWSRTASCTFRPAPASSPIPIRNSSSRSASTRPRRCFAPPKKPSASPAAPPLKRSRCGWAGANKKPGTFVPGFVVRTLRRSIVVEPVEAVDQFGRNHLRVFVLNLPRSRSAAPPL